MFMGSLFEKDSCFIDDGVLVPLGQRAGGAGDTVAAMQQHTERQAENQGREANGKAGGGCGQLPRL
jgi:hypothetical protein